MTLVNGLGEFNTEIEKRTNEEKELWSQTTEKDNFNIETLKNIINSLAIDSVGLPLEEYRNMVNDDLFFRESNIEELKGKKSITMAKLDLTADRLESIEMILDQMMMDIDSLSHELDILYAEKEEEGEFNGER